MSVIKLTDKYSYSFFPDLSERIHEFEKEMAFNGKMIIDLSEVSFVDPFGMISIIGVCRHVFNKLSIQSTVLLPKGEAGSYMERAGFLTIQEQDSFIEVQSRNTFQKIGSFFDIKNNIGVLKFFQSEKDIATINQEVEEWMKSNSFSEEEINSISTFISEMVQNVSQHSNTPQKGVLCIQSYVNRKGEAFLAWAIGDSGIGIRQSLVDAGVKGIKPLSDSRVIREVVRKGISRFTDDITRGNGLSGLYRAAQRRKTTLYIHSHRGVFGWRDKERNLEKDIPLVLGTNVTFYLSQQANK